MSTHTDPLMQFVSNSKDNLLKDFVFLIHGPSKHGKSTLAASVSEFYPKDGVPKKPVSLEDIIWISVDRGATKFSGDAGVIIPHEIDFFGLTRHFKNNPVDAMNASLDLAAKLPGNKVVWDTGSAWDHLVNVHYQQPNQLVLWQSKKGEQDTQAFYRLMLGAHSLAFAKMMSISKTWVLNFHTKAMLDDMKTGDAATRAQHLDTASSLPGNVDFKISVTGAAREMYPAHADLILALRAEEVPGKKGQFVRRVYTQVDKGFQAGSRYQKALAPVEEPHLGKMIDKVRKFLASQEGAGE